MVRELEQGTTCPSSEADDSSLNEATRLLQSSWSLDIQGFIVVTNTNAELWGAEDAFNKLKHCGSDPIDCDYNNRLKKAILKIVTPDLS